MIELVNGGVAMVTVGPHGESEVLEAVSVSGTPISKGAWNRVRALWCMPPVTMPLVTMPLVTMPSVTMPLVTVPAASKGAWNRVRALLSHTLI